MTLIPPPFSHFQPECLSATRSPVYDDWSLCFHIVSQVSIRGGRRKTARKGFVACKSKPYPPLSLPPFPESFEPFDSSVKGGKEVAFRCYRSINAASAWTPGHSVADQMLGRQTHYNEDAVKWIHLTFGLLKKKYMIVAGDDLTVHKSKVYAFSCTVDWLHRIIAMFLFSLAFDFVSELTLFY